jgi:hypothetical protein
MAATPHINRLMLGDDYSCSFTIEKETTKTVSALQKAIKNEKIALQHIDPESLALLKVSIPAGRTLQQVLADLDLTNDFPYHPRTTGPMCSQTGLPVNIYTS